MNSHTITERRFSLDATQMTSPIAESTCFNGTAKPATNWFGRKSPSISPKQIDRSTCLPKLRMIARRKSLSNKSCLIPSRQKLNLTRIDPRVYAEANSIGLVSRVVKYQQDQNNSHLQRSMSVNNLYNRPGQFPVVHLKKKDLTYKATSHTISMTRIPPPDRAIFYGNCVSDILRSNSIMGIYSKTDEELSCENRPILHPPATESEMAPTRSVLEVLKEISRKRIHNNDSQENLNYKKSCGHDFQNYLEANVSMNINSTKRQRELPCQKSLEICESDYMQHNNLPTQTSPVHMAKRRNCSYNNDITSSLSSSVNKTNKRKLHQEQSEISLHRSLTISGRPALDTVKYEQVTKIHRKQNAPSFDEYIQKSTSCVAATPLSAAPSNQTVSITSTQRSEKLAAIPQRNVSTSVSALLNQDPDIIFSSSSKPKLTLFNKNYESYSSADEEKSRDLRSPDIESGECAGIQFVKPKQKDTITVSNNPIIERTQKSKLALMLSGLRGEIYQGEELDEFDINAIKVPNSQESPSKLAQANSVTSFDRAVTSDQIKLSNGKFRETVKILSVETILPNNHATETVSSSPKSGITLAESTTLNTVVPKGTKSLEGDNSSSILSTITTAATKTFTYENSPTTVNASSLNKTVASTLNDVSKTQSKPIFTFGTSTTASINTNNSTLVAPSTVNVSSLNKTVASTLNDVSKAQTKPIFTFETSATASISTNNSSLAAPSVTKDSSSNAPIFNFIGISTIAQTNASLTTTTATIIKPIFCLSTGTATVTTNSVNSVTTNTTLPNRTESKLGFSFGTPNTVITSNGNIEPTTSTTFNFSVTKTTVSKADTTTATTFASPFSNNTLNSTVPTKSFSFRSTTGLTSATSTAVVATPISSSTTSCSPFTNTTSDITTDANKKSDSSLLSDTQIPIATAVNSSFGGFIFKVPTEPSKPLTLEGSNVSEDTALKSNDSILANSSKFSFGSGSGSLAVEANTGDNFGGFSFINSAPNLTTTAIGTTNTSAIFSFGGVATKITTVGETVTTNTSSNQTNSNIFSFGNNTTQNNTSATTSANIFSFRQQAAALTAPFSFGCNTTNGINNQSNLNTSNTSIYIFGEGNAITTNTDNNKTAPSLFTFGTNVTSGNSLLPANNQLTSVFGVQTTNVSNSTTAPSFNFGGNIAPKQGIFSGVTNTQNGSALNSHLSCSSAFSFGGGTPSAAVSTSSSAVGGFSFKSVTAAGKNSTTNTNLFGCAENSMTATTNVGKASFSFGSSSGVGNGSNIEDNKSSTNKATTIFGGSSTTLNKPFIFGGKNTAAATSGGNIFVNPPIIPSAGSGNFSFGNKSINNVSNGSSISVPFSFSGAAGAINSAQSASTKSSQPFAFSSGNTGAVSTSSSTTNLFRSPSQASANNSTSGSIFKFGAAAPPACLQQNNIVSPATGYGDRPMRRATRRLMKNNNS